ncbi:MAG: T9SS type A sorting domain-containing protein [Bacteroidetes bacterium]|nr:T9SS type A sorting domain-containing protein [Bacteroidota bacterium]
MEIFPNPTTGLLTIRISEPQIKLSHIEIYNSMGDLVISTWIENNSYFLDMTSYNQGIYFIRCMDQSRKYHTKSFNLLK